MLQKWRPDRGTLPIGHEGIGGRGEAKTFTKEATARMLTANGYFELGDVALKKRRRIAGLGSEDPKRSCLNRPAARFHMLPTRTVPTKTVPTKICCLNISREFPADLRLPPLSLKVLLESSSLKSRVLVRRLAVRGCLVRRWLRRDGQASLNHQLSTYLYVCWYP